MFMTDATRNTLTMMKEEGINRIVLTSTMGAGDDWARINQLFRALINVSNLKAGYDDRHGVDQVVRASDTDWTLARAVALSNKLADGPLRAAEAGHADQWCRPRRLPPGHRRVGRVDPQGAAPLERTRLTRPTLCTPRYRFRGSATGPPTLGPGMTSPSCC